MKLTKLHYLIPSKPHSVFLSCMDKYIEIFYKGYYNSYYKYNFDIKDNILSLEFDMPQDIMVLLKERFRERRLELNLTREGLSSRSMVSISSIKRFETTGKISLEYLLKIAHTLNCLEDFSLIAKGSDLHNLSLDDILEGNKERKRGTIK